MGTNYEQLSAEEQATIMVMQAQGCQRLAIARSFHRPPSTISRELSHHVTTMGAPNDAHRAGTRARSLRYKPRREAKLAPPSVFFGVVEHHRREGWSLEQIAGTLKRVWPDDSTRTLSQETIYTALYGLPRGELRQERIACWCQGRVGLRPRSGGADRRGQIANMLSLHVTLQPPGDAGKDGTGHGPCGAGRVHGGALSGK